MKTNFSKSIYDNFLLACELGQKEKVSEYIQKGLDINYKRKDGYTPLSKAITYNQHDIVELLLQANVVIPKMSQYPESKNKTFLSVNFKYESQAPSLALLIKYQKYSPALDDESLYSIIDKIKLLEKKQLYEVAFSHLENKTFYITKIVEDYESYHSRIQLFPPLQKELGKTILLKAVEQVADILINNNIIVEERSILKNVQEAKLSKLEQLYLLKKIKKTPTTSKKLKV